MKNLNKVSVRVKGVCGEITIEHEHDLLDQRSVVLERVVELAVKSYKEIKEE